MKNALTVMAMGLAQMLYAFWGDPDEATERLIRALDAYIMKHPEQ